MNGTKNSKVIPVIDPKQLKRALQQAINLEIATIPVYLYTYYSIDRTPDQADLIKAIKKDLPKSMPSKKAAAFAKNYALDVMLYANKAGSLIMSVVVEEMLHMALSSNVKQALFGPPKLVGQTPSFPTSLPGHQPPFPINLGKFSMNQLMTFLKIESPLHFNDIEVGKMTKKHSSVVKAFKYDTIGDFYQGIENCINKNFKAKSNYHRTSGPTAQLVPGKGYYAQNNIDTVYYNKSHKPQFPNADDSGDLVHVVDRKSAIEALHEVVEQGEGHNVKGKTGDHLSANGTVSKELIAKINRGDFSDLDYDDKEKDNKKELSHFARFLELYCNGQALAERLKEATGKDDFEKYFVKDVPENPTEKLYSGTVNKKVLANSKLTNAIYTYLFLMSESCYFNEGNTQFELFMFGIHKSMIWILSGLCGDMMNMKYVQTTKGVNKKYLAAPTFEDYNFKGSKKSPKEQLIELSNAAGGSYTDLINVLPDVSINHRIGIGL